MWYKHITRSFSAIKRGIKRVSIWSPRHFRRVCGDKRRPNITGCTLTIIAACVQKRWRCCAKDEAQKLRREMSDRGSAASGMSEWENNLIPSPHPDLFWYLPGRVVYCRHFKSHLGHKAALVFWLHVTQPAWFQVLGWWLHMKTHLYFEEEFLI